jgi:hypothetical protein
MTITGASHARITLALAAATWLAACSPVGEPTKVTSDEQACQRVMDVLVANQVYRAEQMASCEIGKDEVNPGFYFGRVNAYCRDPQGCGSVLLGWYAVEEKTGTVHEWDYEEWAVAKPFLHQGR